MSVAPFPARVALYPDEPAHGLLLRAAEHNGTRKYHQLFLRFGVRHSFLANNVDPIAVAAACRADPDAVAHASPVATPKTVDLLGQRMHRDHYSVHRRRWCPQCLSEAPYHRAWWDVVAIHACPTHRVKLVTDCGCPKRSTWQSFGITHCRAGHDLRDAAAPSVDEADLVVDRYLVGRLTGVDHIGHPYLEDMPLGEAISLLERLGVTSIDPQGSLRRLRSEVGTERLMIAGYQVLSDFPNGFRALLDGIASVRATRLGAWGVNKVYGEFYYWVQDLPASQLTDAMREELADHAQANTPLKTGTKLADDRHVELGYTLEEAAATVGVASKKFRRIAVEFGLLSVRKRSGHPARLDRSRVHEIAEVLRGAKSMSEIAEELGLGKRAINSIVSAGLLLPLIRAGQSGLNNHEFPREAASELLNRLDCLPVCVGVRSGTPLPVAAQQARLTVARGLQLVLDGTLAITGIDQSAMGLQRYLVSASAIARVAKTMVAPGLNIRAAAVCLQLPYNATMDFVKQGIIKTVSSGKSKSITQEEIDRFKQTYVTVPELSAILGTNRSRDTISILANAGVEPACPRPPYWKVLYWRDGAVAVAETLAGRKSVPPAEPLNDRAPPPLM